MNAPLTENTKAVLLLTAPLIVGRGAASGDVLTPGEYGRLARYLREQKNELADLLLPDAVGLIAGCRPALDPDRIQRLLERGFLLSQAMERWQGRAIWVVSHLDDRYPGRLRERLQEKAPPILYGCGEDAILDTGGLAVVGSRNVDESLVRYTKDVGQLAAEAEQTVMSGGARGIDQAAMQGALEAGGKVGGGLADSLERAALSREHRRLFMDGQLVLVSPFDPAAGFSVGNAMQRNKLIYALGDAALVVSSDYQKGGTWAGAVEQLGKLHFVPVYVRASGEIGQGLEALRKRGALPWPEPSTPRALLEVLAAQSRSEGGPGHPEQLPLSVSEGPAASNEAPESAATESGKPASPAAVPPANPADELFAVVKPFAMRASRGKTAKEVAEQLAVQETQARQWLERLVREDLLKKAGRPARYRAAGSWATQGSSSAAPPSTASPDELFAAIKSLIVQFNREMTAKEVGKELAVQDGQARRWLQRLVEEGILEERGRPARYRVARTKAIQRSLSFDGYE